ncbi:hypothetical protein ACJIZ3_001059 [Penstemon smallii]|uniref:Transmembrane protein n=1 Tax=Penstemon smallii TaxID=265156 RepID=A0ABD3U415_9LAMI
MREIWTERWLRFLALFSSISLHFVTVYSDESSTPKHGTKTEDHAPSSGGSKGSTIAIVFVVLVGVSVLSFFLYKFWQKKKREEQYARLLKLFEEDDELELELGLRD